jgi:hypothetical protein
MISFNAYQEQTKAPSGYNPSKEVKDFTSYVQRDYATGHDILHRSWPELNNRSVLEDMNHGRQMFNGFVDESVEDPAEAWKWRGTRSMARNKGIAMHANLTVSYLIPAFMAQNEDSSIDEDYSDFMRDIVEWMIDNSDYKPNFLGLVFAMETDPVVYLGAEYARVMQTIKEKTETGVTTKEIVDEVLSGFKAPIYTADQILISNAYERDIQKHRAVIKRRWIEYDEAEAMYGSHPDWEHVMRGMRTVYSQDDGLFYDIKDDDHPNLVEEVTYMNRRQDTQVCFVGGIYMGDSDVDANPMKHRDNYGAPRYNIEPFRFNTIGSHFFFGKSMMNAMRWDNALYDAMSEIVMNRSILEVERPIAVSGTDKIDTEIIFPNAVVSFSDKDTKVQDLLPKADLNAGINALKMTEESMSDASVNETISGQLPSASQKAFNVAQAQSNARKLIGGVAKSLAWSVSKYGSLMADIAINHLTVPQVDDIVGDGTKLKYRKFLLDGKNVGGKNMSKELRFDDNLLGADMSEEDKDAYNLKLLSEVGYPENKKHIYTANPEMFAKLKYYCRADYEEVFQKDPEYWQPIMQGLYGQLNADPMIEREALLRETMRAFFRGKADKFIAKQPMMGMGGLPAQTPQPMNPMAANPMSTPKPTAQAPQPVA